MNLNWAGSDEKSSGKACIANSMSCRHGRTLFNTLKPPVNQGPPSRQRQKEVQVGRATSLPMSRLRRASHSSNTSFGVAAGSLLSASILRALSCMASSMVFGVS